MSEIEPVAQDVGSGASRSPLGLFEAANCKRIDLRYRVTRDKFAVSRFLAFFNQTEEKNANSFVVCRTLDPEKLDYHMHFTWDFHKEVVTFYIAFVSGVVQKSENEHEPYAERFMPWFGDFFSNETAHADLHLDFSYSLESRQSRFPLPLKANIVDDLETEIDGISVSFVSLPEGIASARILQGKKRLNLDLRGTVRTTFALFDLQSEISRISPVALRLTRNTK